MRNPKIYTHEMHWPMLKARKLNFYSQLVFLSIYLWPLFYHKFVIGTIGRLLILETVIGIVWQWHNGRNEMKIKEVALNRIKINAKVCEWFRQRDSINKNEAIFWYYAYGSVWIVWISGEVYYRSRRQKSDNSNEQSAHSHILTLLYWMRIWYGSYLQFKPFIPFAKVSVNNVFANAQSEDECRAKETVLFNITNRKDLW